MGKPKSKSKPKSESGTTRTGNFVFWAVIAGLVAFATLGGFVPGYTPTCDNQPMSPGDSCIGSGGGSYDQMVGDHYRNDQVVFVISFSLMILLTVLAVRERGRDRARKRFAETHRVATSVSQDPPGTGVWIGVGLLPGKHRRLRGKDPVLLAESDMVGAVSEKVGDCVNRDGRLRTDRHTWIVITDCTSGDGDRAGLTRLADATAQALARTGIDAEHAHITTRTAKRDPARLSTLYYPHSAPGEFFGFESRMEFELIQPRMDPRVPRTGPRLRDTDLENPFPGNGNDKLRCPVDHLVSMPAADVYDVWSRAWSGPGAAGFGTYSPVHAELLAARRCPACLTEELDDAPPTTLRGKQRSTGRCPCCEARWLTGEPNDWACLEQGRLSVT